jgi:hypothetical protein
VASYEAKGQEVAMAWEEEGKSVVPDDGETSAADKGMDKMVGPR